MSYDLMVFRPQAASDKRDEFIAWYREQTEWNEGHSYDDPAICSEPMKKFFMEMIKIFPPLNGPYAGTDPEDDHTADYTIGKDVIYISFSWPVAERAYTATKTFAAKHEIGFFDVSADHGDILFPDGTGRFIGVDTQVNTSSIQQIKNSESKKK